MIEVAAIVGKVLLVGILCNAFFLFYELKNNGKKLLVYFSGKGNKLIILAKNNDYPLLSARSIP